VGPELGGALRVWLHLALQAGPHPWLQGQSRADSTQLDVLHQLLPTFLGEWGGQKMALSNINNYTVIRVLQWRVILCALYIRV
jgi:hypothetical protein